MRRSRLAPALPFILTVWVWAACDSGSGPSTSPSPAKPDVTIALGAESGTTIRPLLGVNAGPTPQGDAGNADVTVGYQTIGVQSVRTHDLYGPLDMSVMYPDPSQDPQAASSYNFAASDAAFAAIVAGGFGCYLRLGDSWDNVSPPATAAERANWAAAAVHVVGRYHSLHPLRHVEVGNEPDNGQFWPAPRTRLEFFDLYAQTARAVKAAYPSLSVGGPGLTHLVFTRDSGRQYLADFLAYIREHEAPLDFLSWHLYSNDPAEMAAGAAYIRQQLDASGFAAAESHQTEYNTDAQNADPAAVRLGGQGAAILTGHWIAMQHAGVSQALLFRGNDTSLLLPTFYGLFYADGRPKRNAHAFSLWSRMATHDRMINVSITGGKTGAATGLYLLAGRNPTGKKALLAANPTAGELTVVVTGLRAPLRQYLVSDNSEALQVSTLTSTTASVPANGTMLLQEE